MQIRIMQRRAASETQTNAATEQDCSSKCKARQDSDGKELETDGRQTSGLDEQSLLKRTVRIEKVHMPRRRL